MKIVKIVLALLAFVLIGLIIILTFGLNSASFLDKAASTAIKKSGLDISYKSIEGGLYSGLAIKEFSYQDDVKADLKLVMDFMALKEGRIKVEEVNLSNLTIAEDFLASLMKPADKETESSSKTESFIKEVIVDKLHIDAHDIVYETYRVNHLSLDVHDFYFDMKERFSGKVKGVLDTNVALAHIDAVLKDSRYDAQIEADVQKDFIAPYLVDSNVTVESVPRLSLAAKGDLEQVLVDVTLGDGKLFLQDILISPQGIDIHADVGIKSGDIKADVKGHIESDIANIHVVGDTSLNSNDINNTLQFDIKNHIVGNDVYLLKMLKDKNISIPNMPALAIDAKGDLKAIKLQSHLKDGEIYLEGFKIYPKALNLDAVYDLQKKTVDATLRSQVDSNVANVNLDSKVSVHLEDINNSLKYDSKGTIQAQSAYIAAGSKDANISVDKLSPLRIMIEGDRKALDAVVSLDGEVRYEDLLVKPEIKETQIHLDLIKMAIDSNLHAFIDTNKGNIKLDSKLSGVLEDINNTLRYDGSLAIKDAKAYKGVDLSSLGDIFVEGKGSLKELSAFIKSDKINADVESEDFDTFHLNLDTKKIYLSKIYQDVPADLQKSFVALKGAGFYTLSKKEAKLSARLKGLKYNKHTLFTNEFTLSMKEEDISLSPLVLRSKDFKVTMDAKKVGNNIVAHIKNRAFFANAKVVMDPLKVHADGEISSIDKLLKEVDKIYPVDTSMGIDGAVKFQARMQGKAVKASVTSPKISLKEGRLEKVNLLALYEGDTIRLKNFDFDIKGFEGKGMNRPVRLKREGIITFNDENASVDVELDKLLFFKGEKKGDVITGKFSTQTLALAYPEYGETKVTTDLEMFQSDGKMAVTGEVRFKETEVNYQSRFLDISKDSDIIIISKKEKEKKTNDNFLQNTFLDIKIVSDDEILYKVDDGEIELQPDMIVRKDFGQVQKITGKINILDGMYDFADKRFIIKEGAVAFRGLDEINPLLDLHVEYDEIDDILIKIDIGGDKNRPKLAFSSEPMKSKKDIFSYLLFGMSSSETEGAATSANKAAERIFGRAVAKDLARELNLDRLDMNRNIDGGIDVKAGKKLNRKSILYYQNKSTESSVIYERKLSKNWEVDTEVGKLGQSVDFVYRKGFK